jgi:hypothetical protein
VKKLPEMWPNLFFVKIYTQLFLGKKIAKIFATSIILANTSKLNIFPRGDNSPNLVTLTASIFSGNFFRGEKKG